MVWLIGISNYSRLTFALSHNPYLNPEVELFTFTLHDSTLPYPQAGSEYGNSDRRQNARRLWCMDVGGHSGRRQGRPQGSQVAPPKAPWGAIRS